MNMQPKTKEKLDVLARELAAGKSVREAMRTAGYSAQSAKRGEIRGPGRRLIPVRDHPYVAARLDELHEDARARHRVTVDSVSAKLHRSYEGAMRKEQFSAATQAAMGLAKLHGLIVDHSKHTFSKPLDQWTEAEIDQVLGEEDAADAGPGARTH